MNKNSAALKNSDATPHNTKLLKAKKPQNKHGQKPSTDLKEEATNHKLTEKQLRKLEWEQKLAERKHGELKDDKEALSKAELKARRREQQEAQRQAKIEKEEVIGDKVKAKAEGQLEAASKETIESRPVNKSPEKVLIKKQLDSKKPKTKYVQLVQHLYREANLECSSKIVNFKNVHPVFVRLGVQYSEKVILGSNARCLALLAAIKTLIDDIQAPPKQEFCRYVQEVVLSCTNYLQGCRPFAVSMTNALRSFKLHLTQIDTNLSDNEKRAKLIDVVDTYIQNDIKKAWDAICMKVNEKIVDGDIILIYGCSSLVKKIFLVAKSNGKKFSVIIVDSRPLLEGREMLRRLVCAEIKCNYVLINGLSFVMKQATKVFLGAHALLTNGSVMSRIGTAQVALMAQAYNKPVLVCCETYKFSEKVQTDSFVYNEIGNPDLLLSMDTSNNPSPLSSQKDNNRLNILNLLYDVTPPDLVTAVVTELAILPCTSVPVVMRINQGENMV